MIIGALRHVALGMTECDLIVTAKDAKINSPSLPYQAKIKESCDIRE
jgi:hypothetical protein